MSSSVTAIPNLSTYRTTLSTHRLVIVDFWSQECAPCRMLKPKFEALAAQYPQIRSVSVDVEEARDVLREERVRALPTFVMYRGGERVGELVGPTPAALAAAFEEFASIA